MYTVEWVKHHLPTVKILYAGKVYTGFVRGHWQDKFPTVWFYPGPAEVNVLPIAYEFSWQAIVESKNTETPLIP